MFTEVAMQKSQEQIKETLLKRNILYYLYLMALWYNKKSYAVPENNIVV